MASYRIPRKTNLGETGYPYLLGGRSQCPQCNRGLRNRDLVPILSYLLLRGKCFFCKKKISSRYLFIELAACACFLICILASNDNLVESLFSVLWLVFCYCPHRYRTRTSARSDYAPTLMDRTNRQLVSRNSAFECCRSWSHLGYVSLWLLFGSINF